jgi:hypothetical protein
MDFLLEEDIMLRIIESGAFSKDFGFYKKREPHPRFVASQSVIERSAPKPKVAPPANEVTQSGNPLMHSVEDHLDKTPGRNETTIFTAPGHQDTKLQQKELDASDTK